MKRLLLVLVFVAIGCKGKGDGDGKAKGSAGSPAASGSATASAGTGSASAGTGSAGTAAPTTPAPGAIANVCTYITAADVSTIMGSKLVSNQGETDCMLEGPPDQPAPASVALDIKEGDLIPTWKEMSKGDATGKDVTGLGDAAFMYGAMQINLIVKKGAHTLLVTITPMNDASASESNREKAQAIATHIVAKMP